MLTLEIPGHKTITAEHLVLDYNGTLAVDGRMIDGVAQLLKELSKQVSIHVLTADTFGSVKENVGTLNFKLLIMNQLEQDIAKETYILSLGKESVIAIGNGMNDVLMLDKAGLSIMIVQAEGACAKLFGVSDIVCTSVIDALGLLLNPLRVVATLRK